MARTKEEPIRRTTAETNWKVMRKQKQRNKETTQTNKQTNKLTI